VLVAPAFTSTLKSSASLHTVTKLLARVREFLHHGVPQLHSVVLTRQFYIGICVTINVTISGIMISFQEDSYDC